MNELMWAEIWDQPEALRRSLEPLRAQAAGAARLVREARRIILTGCGDSYFAPLALGRAYQTHLTIPVETLPAMEAAQYIDFRPGDLLVAISISGEVRRTLEAAVSARAGGAAVVALTARAESTLAQSSDGALTLPVPARSRQTPHTTDFLSTLLALAALLEAGSSRAFQELDALPDQVAAVLNSVADRCPIIIHALPPTARFFFLGAGPNWAVAQYCAAKFWEAGGLEGLAFELEEFAHGPHFLLSPGDAVVLFAPDERSQPRAVEMWDGFERLGVNAFAVADAAAHFPAEAILPVPRLPAHWSPFVTSLPGQLLTLAAANARGHDVVSKAGRLPDAALYEHVHRQWTGGSALRPVAGPTGRQHA